MSSKFLLATAGLFAALSAQATVSVTSASFTYGETFDSIAAPAAATLWSTSALAADWSLFRTGTVNYIAGTGSSNAGGFYSFGASAAATDRALGSVASGTTGTETIALSLTNNSGVTLDSFTIRYDGEQWRNGGVAAVHSLTLEYGFGATYAGVGAAWTAAGAGFNFNSLVNTTIAAPVDGNAAGKVANIGGTVTTGWAPGTTLWIRWTDVDNTGGDHGLAIDNLSLSVTAAAVPEPSTYAMLLAGIGAIGFIARRRRG